MISCPKVLPFRSDKLRWLAKVIPACQGCGAHNHGQVVLAHSNSLQHGKGMGTKADDLPCYLCDECHNKLDGRSGHLSPSEKLDLYHRATVASTAWLLRNDYLKVS